MGAESVVRKWEYKLHHMKNRSCRVCPACNRTAKLHIIMKMDKVSGPAPLNASLNLSTKWHEHTPAKVKRTSCECFLLDKERIVQLNMLRARRLALLILRHKYSKPSKDQKEVFAEQVKAFELLLSAEKALMVYRGQSTIRSAKMLLVNELGDALLLDSNYSDADLRTRLNKTSLYNA